MERQKELDAGVLPDFPVATADVRAADWTVAPAPADLDDRRVEITGPAEPKMMINALNSGARVFMADLEDSLSPTWANVIGGQAALRSAVRRELTFDSPEGKAYRLNEKLATLVVRPRGWHLIERDVLVDGVPISASLFDFGLYFFHNAAELLATRLRAVLLPAEARRPRRGSPLERRLPPRPGVARHSARIDPGDGPDRDDPRRLRDGRDPPRAARARRRPQRRTLGLPLQRDQEVPRLGRPGPPGAWPADDDAAVHARLHGAARPDVPPTRRPRDRRHGGVHPVAPRPGGERDGDGAGPRRQGAGVGRRLRRDVGRPSGPRPAGDGDLRRRPGRSAQPEGPPARGGRRDRRPASRPQGPRRDRDGGGLPAERQRRNPVPGCLARRQRRGGDQQPDGGRGDRRDLSLPALAMANDRHASSTTGGRPRPTSTRQFATRSSPAWAARTARRRSDWRTPPACSIGSSSTTTSPSS